MNLLNIFENLITLTEDKKDQIIFRTKELDLWDQLQLFKNYNWLFVIVIPLILIFIISFYVGFERQNVGKAAGVSSHILVGVTACAIAIMQHLMFLYLDSKGKADGSGGQRIIAQVVAGVSFVGAGVIMKSNKTIKGLTTATTIWTVAMIGLILGSGYLIIGSILGAFVMSFITIRDLSRKINPFKPGIERSLIIKKYRFNRDSKTENDKVIEDKDQDDSLTDNDDDKHFL